MQIAILMFNGFSALDAFGPSEIFRSTWQAEVRFVAETPGLYHNDSAELSVQVAHSLADTRSPDVIILPGGPGACEQIHNAEILRWLNTTHATARWTGGICSGVLLLGAAGLLCGVPATTHWRLQTELMSFGASYVRENMVRSGKILSAANSSAGLEMAGYITRQLVDMPFVRAARTATARPVLVAP